MNQTGSHNNNRQMGEGVCVLDVVPVWAVRMVTNTMSSNRSKDDDIEWQGVEDGPFLRTFIVGCVCCVAFAIIVPLLLRKEIKVTKSANQASIASTKTAKDDQAETSSRSRKDEKREQQQRRKTLFLQRAGDDYGYRSSPAGFIDAWRKEEFPNLMGPVVVNDGLPSTFCTSNASEKNKTDSQDDSCDGDCEVYLDAAGAALPSRSLLTAIHNDSMTRSSVLANPHSSGPAAARTLRWMEQAKKEILDHFHGHPGRFASIADGDHHQQYSSPCDEDLFHPGYEIVFTSGTTEALRIVAEHFPWSDGKTNNDGDNDQHQPHSVLLYPHNAHTSVVGMRGSVLAKGGHFVCKHLDDILQMANDNCNLQEALASMTTSAVQSHNKSEDTSPSSNQTRNLLVLPAECNFGGDRPNVAKLLRRFRSLDRHCSTSRANGVGRWFTMLDLAKAAATGPINLRELDPDFACLSFYKLFGYPTGLGVLLVRRTASHLLLPSIRNSANNNNTHKSSTSESMPSIHHYFGGGSVDVVLSGLDFAVGRNLGSSSTLSTRSIAPSSLASLTHGTVHFRGIVSLTHGFRELKHLGGMGHIQKHTKILAQELVRRLKSLRHGNHRPVVEIYGAWKNAGALDKSPGPVVAFNVRRSNGEFAGYHEIANLAALNNPPLQLRTGCFCNPGACQDALKLSDQDILLNYEESGHVCGDDVDIVRGRPTGAIRASFGKESIWEDLDALVVFIEKHFVCSGSSTSTEQYTAAPSYPTKATLSEMYIYPIKSCAGQKVRQWNMTSSGRLEYDREFALVDSFGKALRLQYYPRMCFVQPTIDHEQNILKVSAPGMADLIMTLGATKHDNSFMQSVVSVCGNKCSGLVWGDVGASEWFSSYLGVECWLARYNRSPDHGAPGAPESTSPASPDSKSSSMRNGFSNENPLLLISKQAVEELNAVLTDQGQPTVSAQQFRPNFVVDCPDQLSCNPEDSWVSIEMENGPTLFVCGLCARCAMVDVDPSTGKSGKALRALANYRRDRGAIHFGIFLRLDEERKQSSAVVECPSGILVKS